MRSDSSTKFWGIGPEPKNTPVKQAFDDNEDGDNDDDDNNNDNDNDVNDNDDEKDKHDSASQRKSAENSVISDISSES